MRAARSAASLGLVPVSRRLVVTVAVIFVAAVIVWWTGTGAAQRVANDSRDPSVSPSTAVAAEREAHTFWDNPFQRLLYAAMSTTDVKQGATCPRYEVTAFALFGAEIDRVFVDCMGVNRIP